MSVRHSGIYAWRTANGLYVGSAIDLGKRRHNHLTDLRRGVHNNRFLQNAYYKHHPRFYFEILLLCDPSDLIRCEQHFIDTLKPRYNLCRFAGSSLGIKRREATKAKVRAAVRAVWEDPSYRANFVIKLKAVWRDPVMRSRYQNAAKRAWNDPEKRARILASRRSPDAITRLKAAQSTKEFKAKKRAAALEQWADPEQRKKLLFARSVR